MLELVMVELVMAVLVMVGLELELVLVGLAVRTLAHAQPLPRRWLSWFPPW